MQSIPVKSFIVALLLVMLASCSSTPPTKVAAGYVPFTAYEDEYVRILPGINPMAPTTMIIKVNKQFYIC